MHVAAYLTIGVKTISTLIFLILSTAYLDIKKRKKHHFEFGIGSKAIAILVFTYFLSNAVDAVTCFCDSSNPKEDKENSYPAASLAKLPIASILLNIFQGRFWKLWDLEGLRKCTALDIPPIARTTLLDNCAQGQLLVFRLMQICIFFYVGMRIADIYLINGHKRTEKTISDLGRSFFLAEHHFFPKQKKDDETSTTNGESSNGSTSTSGSKRNSISSSVQHSLRKGHHHSGMVRINLAQRIELAKVEYLAAIFLKGTEINPDDLYQPSDSYKVAFLLSLECIFQLLILQPFLMHVVLPLRDMAQLETWRPYGIFPFSHRSLPVHQLPLKVIFYDWVFLISLGFLIYLLVTFFLKLGFLPMMIVFDGDYRAGFDAPWRSTTVKEFWRYRWNRYFQHCFFRLFAPLLKQQNPGQVKSKGGLSVKLVLALLIFAYSGLMHDIFIWVGMLPQQRTLEMTLFFLIQAIAVLAEDYLWPFSTLIKKGPAFIGWSWTLIFLTATCPLFIRPFLASTNVTDPSKLIYLF